jgi:uncharacterized protein (TIGR02466 family)
VAGFHQGQVNRAYGLIEAGRGGEAVAITSALVEAAPTDHGVIAAHAAALKAAGRKPEALPFNQRAIQLFPQSGVAWHNLAATLDDIGRHEEAIAAVERAFRLGANSPQTRLVLCHAHMHRGDYAGAEQGFRQILRERPQHCDAAEELARLIFGLSGDWRAAVAPLRALRAAGGPEQGAILLEARILAAAGCTAERDALFAEALEQRPDDVVILCAAAHAANVGGDAERAAELAERAVRLAPDYAQALIQLADVRLVQGRGPEALAVSRRAVQAAPSDLSTWAWLATAARAAADPIAGELCDYDAMVQSFRIAAPPGWASLEAYLSDLARALERQHKLEFEPPDQSVRGGTQTTADLSRSQIPELKALFAALDAPIRSYLAAIGSGPGPLRGRNAGRYRVDSAWSVRLRPQGFHDNHFHSHGWISCAFYVATPEAVRSEAGREGWLKLGEPPAPNSSAFPPERFVRPEPGLLVLFPSYMWHGTIPFMTGDTRLSVAFDLLPA